MALSAFFKKITVTSTTFAGSRTPDIEIPFEAVGISMLNEDVSSIVEVSYDGVNVHDELNPALASKGVTYDNRSIAVLWFRLKTGTSAIISVRSW